MGFRWLQTGDNLLARIEQWLERERDQLFLWSPVALGAGIAAWFALSGRPSWIGWVVLMLGVAMLGLLAPSGSRVRRATAGAGLLATLGLALVWWRAERVTTPVVVRPAVTTFTGRVLDADLLAAREAWRVVLEPDAGAELPPKVRVSIDLQNAPAELAPGDRLRLRARLIAPPGPAVPGSFDFARVAWFQGLGGVGKAIGPVERVSANESGAGLRQRLATHVRSRIDGSAGGIAAAFATGDRGGIADADEEAMRASGLTHLLSISGLHITAVVGAAMLVSLRLLALSRWAALRLPLVTLSAGIGALAGLGYTLLSGAEVPTVRSCVAAMLVMVGLALGREALTLRLVAAGALFVLLLWPESLVGPSFQLSFAAIVTIVALHEHGGVRRWFARRDEHPAARLLRGMAGLLLTGVAVEVALAPIALFHFHKTGVYGALANIIAIPLTTFVTMPLEALALLFDLIGLGAPFWWATGLSLEFLLWLARLVAAVPLSQAVLPEVPVPAFALMIGGGIWLLLWRTRIRALGLLPFFLGAALALTTRAPDLIVTGDGKHVAVRGADGRYAVLRPRAGDYVRSVLGERGGTLEELGDLDDLPEAGCTADLCAVTLRAGGARNWQLLATRSPYRLDRAGFQAACARADLVVSDRWLPEWCRPRWLKADKATLQRTGGMAIDLVHGHVETVAKDQGNHPWVRAP